MKSIYLFITLFCCSKSIHAQSGTVDPETKAYSLRGNLTSNYMFFGYKEPSSSAEKLILFSTFPIDQANTARQYPLGAYHETAGLEDGDRLEYAGKKAGFAEMKFIDAKNKVTTFYIREGYVKTAP